LLVHVLDVAGVGHAKLLKVGHKEMETIRMWKEDIALQQLCQVI
jgi:hypothetical protein